MQFLTFQLFHQNKISLSLDFKKKNSSKKMAHESSLAYDPRICPFCAREQQGEHSDLDPRSTVETLKPQHQPASASEVWRRCGRCGWSWYWCVFHEHWVVAEPGRALHCSRPRAWAVRVVQGQQQQQQTWLGPFFDETYDAMFERYVGCEKVALSHVEPLFVPPQVEKMLAAPSNDQHQQQEQEDRLEEDRQEQRHPDQNDRYQRFRVVVGSGFYHGWILTDFAARLFGETIAEERCIGPFPTLPELLAWLGEYQKSWPGAAQDYGCLSESSFSVRFVQTYSVSTSPHKQVSARFL
jgi:hypothetical protein